MDNERSSFSSEVYIQSESRIQDSWQPFALELGGQSTQQRKITHHRRAVITSSLRAVPVEM